MEMTITDSINTYKADLLKISETASREKLAEILEYIIKTDNRNTANPDGTVPFADAWDAFCTNYDERFPSPYITDCAL